ncbi:helix-turn-helix domain-containing protein [Pseudomonas asplenii]|uniref:Helix-turn-helix domain-containing protein n=1 Tax=Pseudomonas asplenii TaxID=53407 RepID=A0A1H6MP66_9PSED|nr:helix-turn-helix domain-containing protein [Pseudomonas fuscovaginae]SEI03638.1 Helix-turn-helix domain-containing protein [Pseudomonas fuscovaginae]
MTTQGINRLACNTPSPASFQRAGADLPTAAKNFSVLLPTDLLTPEQVADVLGLSPRTLAAWRSSRRNDLPWIKVGARIRYRRGDVISWLEGLACPSALEA